MPSPVHRPHVVITVQGSDPTELHATTLTALASQSEAFACLNTTGQVCVGDLSKDIERLLSDENEPRDTPKAWRFIQTNTAYLGPTFFANPDDHLVAHTDEASVHVTDTGFTLRTNGHPDIEFLAIETTKTRTALILSDGSESGSLQSDQICLAQDLSDGHPYVTAVPASFTLGAQQPLYRLRARLMQGNGDTASLTA